MTKRPDTWMPLFVGDYLADTMHLTRDQHGGYMLLIFAYWRSGAPLLDDDGTLSAIARATLAEWKKLRPVLVRFFAVSDGSWRHKRIDKELERAAKRTAERSKAGTNGAAKRWQTHDKKIAEPSPSHKQNDASLHSSSLRSEDSDADASGGEPPPRPPDPVKDLWERGVAILGKGQRSLFGKLRKTYGDPVILAAIVECENEYPTDPPAYFVACCERRKGNGRSQDGHARALDTLARAAIEFDERQGNRGPAETPH